QGLRSALSRLQAEQPDWADSLDRLAEAVERYDWNGLAEMLRPSLEGAEDAEPPGAATEPGA
ncbi:hypothetical protein DBR42_01570, partial [Pelomonas sp. HMWF004]